MHRVRHEANFEVIVVDNNSEDGSPQMVANDFAWVTLLHQKVNLGFTGGQNLAIQSRKGRHAMPLNSDTIVHPGAISNLIEYLADHPEVGIVAPKLLNPDGSLQFSCRRFPNPVAALFRNTILGKLFPNNRFTREYLMQEWGHDAPRDVDWVSGAAFLYRDKLIESVGLFDPSYFMFCEDVDLCWRTWKAGHKVVYMPSATITHAIGKSTDKAPNRMIGRFHRSMFRFYCLNSSKSLPFVVRPFAIGLAGIVLLARASLFILSNKIDVLRRKATSI